MGGLLIRFMGYSTRIGTILQNAYLSVVLVPISLFTLKVLLYSVFGYSQRRVLCIYTFSFCQFFRKRLNPHKTKFLLYGEKMKFRICRDPLSFSFLCKRVGKLGAYESIPYKYLISPFANEI